MAGRNKNEKKLVRLATEFKSDGKTLNISTDEEGKATITITESDSIVTFQASDEQTDRIRFFFWDNYRKHHMWRTKDQKKAERLKTQESVPPSKGITYERIEFPSFPDFNIDSFIK
ncbi:MAG: hypothetical protein AB2L24_29415 [Mangrovibacterium sp.]